MSVTSSDRVLSKATGSYAVFMKSETKQSDAVILWLLRLNIVC
jgi:hypothetical protein